MNSRKLSVSDYLKVLQLEYLTYRIRSLMFDKSEFIKMNKDIAEKKKEKILDLSRKFRLENIFDSQHNFQSFINESFLNDSGLPNFQYSVDESKKRSQLYWDKRYLLKIGTIVFFRGLEYLIKDNLIDSNQLVLSLNKEICYASYLDVKIKNLVTCFDGKLM